MTGLRLPPPCRGLRDRVPRVGWGTGSLDDARRAFGERTTTGTVVLAIRTLSNIGRAEPSGESFAHRLDRDVDRQPHSSLEDIAMTSAVLILALGTLVWARGDAARPPARVFRRLGPDQGLAPARGLRRKSLAGSSSPARLPRCLRLRRRLPRLPRLRPRSLPAPQAPAKVCRRLRLRLRSLRPPGSGQGSPAPQAPARSGRRPSSGQGPRHLRLRARLHRAPSSGQGPPAPQAPAKVLPAPRLRPRLAGTPGSGQGFGPILITQAKWRTEFVGSVSRVQDTLASH